MNVNKEINNNDISVVVQGPIVGSKNDKYEDRHTFICLKSIRKYLPGATIILSTWKGSDVEGLDYDILVENQDPGTTIVGNFSSNCLRQVVSSINGLKKCNTKYAIKMRTDLVLKGNEFISYFIKYNQLQFDQNYKILKQRVVTLTTCNPSRKFRFPFSVSDWFFFGLTEDVKNIFDISLINKSVTKKDENDNERINDTFYQPEQHIWVSFLSKYKQISLRHTTDASNDNIVMSEKYLANNCVLLTARQVGIDWQKYPGAAYAQIPCLSNTGLYTFNEYKKILNKYANNNLLIIPNILEEIVYFIVYNLRFFVKKKNPKLHDFICRLVNRRNHERVKERSTKTNVK